MNNFDNLMKQFNEDANGVDNMELAILVMKYSKDINDRYTNEEKHHFMEQLMNTMSTEDLEKAKKYANLLKN